jgi:hypothetical protein
MESPIHNQEGLGVQLTVPFAMVAVEKNVGFRRRRCRFLLAHHSLGNHSSYLLPQSYLRHLPYLQARASS